MTIECNVRKLKWKEIGNPEDKDFGWYVNVEELCNLNFDELKRKLVNGNPNWNILQINSIISFMKYFLCSIDERRFIAEMDTWRSNFDNKIKKIRYNDTTN